ncbi:MAG: hypothetical protein BWZ08_02303 [candidate division BRC1 bacterium ADurb.BinA292]|nr:MAG: hypothetical protein BWZ08_02303 [candidate division BRC1 bacterium ADurb.BinA292]
MEGNEQTANAEPTASTPPVTVKLTEREQRIRAVGALDVQIEATEMRLHEMRQRRDAIVRSLAEGQEAKAETPAE